MIAWTSPAVTIKNQNGDQEIGTPLPQQESFLWLSNASI